MMQKSIASDEAEMRYAPQTMLSIYSKYILHSLILTIPCSVCNTQNTGYRSRVHCTIMVAQCTRLLSCTLRHFQSIRARQELFTVNIQSIHAHRSRVHCTTSKVISAQVGSVYIAPLSKYTCTHRSRNRGRLTLLHRPQSVSGAGLPWRLLVAIEY